MGEAEPVSTGKKSEEASRQVLLESSVPGAGFHQKSSSPGPICSLPFFFKSQIAALKPGKTDRKPDEWRDILEFQQREETSVQLTGVPSPPHSLLFAGPSPSFAAADRQKPTCCLFYHGRPALFKSVSRLHRPRWPASYETVCPLDVDGSPLGFLLLYCVLHPRALSLGWTSLLPKLRHIYGRLRLASKAASLSTLHNLASIVSINIMGLLYVKEPLYQTFLTTFSTTNSQLTWREKCARNASGVARGQETC